MIPHAPYWGAAATAGVAKIKSCANACDHGLSLKSLSRASPITVGPLKIGDDVITKDSLFVIIVEIDTRIYKTYPKLDYTIVHPKYPRDSLSSIYIMQ